MVRLMVGEGVTLTQRHAKGGTTSVQRARLAPLSFHLCPSLCHQNQMLSPARERSSTGDSSMPRCFCPATVSRCRFRCSPIAARRHSETTPMQPPMLSVEAPLLLSRLACLVQFSASDREYLCEPPESAPDRPVRAASVETTVPVGEVQLFRRNGAAVDLD